MIGNIVTTLIVVLVAPFVLVAWALARIAVWVIGWMVTKWEPDWEGEGL